jgi:hypothetical protein
MPSLLELLSPARRDSSISVSKRPVSRKIIRDDRAALIILGEA